MLEAVKSNKGLMVKGFWAGIGFWTASKIVLEVYRFIKEYLMEGF